MVKVLTAFLVMALSGCGGAPAFAAAENKCIPESGPHGAISEKGGKWIKLTDGQWQFMRGAYILDPETSAGLPYGDGAVLVQVPGDKGGVVFFTDGDKVCSPMTIPAELVELLLNSVNVYHEGTGT